MKTLKDFELEAKKERRRIAKIQEKEKLGYASSGIYGNDWLKANERIVFCQELKAENVKIHNASIYSLIEYLELKDISRIEIEFLRKFLRKFNNLTEEDLKDGRN